MGKSIRAKVISDLLKLWPKHTAEESEAKLADVLRKGEKPTTPPIGMHIRYEDDENGRIFYVNEKSGSRYVVFYIHGGAYRFDIILPQWKFIEKLAGKTDAQIVVPAYHLVPFATYKEAYDLIVPVYQRFCRQYPYKKFILMGDSAGGGFSLSLAEYFKQEGIRMPDELILLSPWVDVSMENEEIPVYQPQDPLLDPGPLKAVAEYWADGLDLHDWRVSPIYGDLQGICNVTIFTGTSEIFYPDLVKLKGLLTDDPSNELIIGEGMNHVYPLFPIPEAKPAVEKIIQTIMR